MINFNLNFNGYIDGRPYSFTCSRTFDELPHQVQEDSTFLLVGADENDDVSLVVTHMDLVQHAGVLTSSIEWELDSTLEDGRVSEYGVEKIRRVLEFNGWSWKVAEL